MSEISLSDAEKKVLSYISRGVSKSTAVDKISKFFSMTPNEVMGAVNSLRKQNLVIENQGVGAGVVVYTTSPLKVKPTMLDQQVLTLLKEAEQGGRASGFKRKAYTTNPDTGEVMDEETAKRKIQAKKASPDLGFDIEE